MGFRRAKNIRFPLSSDSLQRLAIIRKRRRMYSKESADPRIRQLAHIKQMQELAKSRYPSPTSPEPSQGDIAAWCDATPQYAKATDGCQVELDGVCSHGYPSW